MKTSTKISLYDPESSKYLNEETMQVINDTHNGIGINTYDTFNEFVKAMNAL